ncbi:hypothetical protein [Bradyrhizobium sp. CCBAU 53338]|uniref:hypothetical protein n=1 Tax=Bradyrhizobium sp. CCBAU 53338 TaxID=1325111 RepID=UPI00188AD63D|nr:hypothetical protein [Bradyrhizobium sp. CCBAU 53338]
MDTNETPADVTGWLELQLAKKRPAIVGSLSLRRSPCMRENCPACQSGEKHPSHVLYGRHKGRRFSIYVPDQLVPEVQQFLDNGRALQDLLYDFTERYMKALKRARTSTKESAD